MPGITFTIPNTLATQTGPTVSATLFDQNWAAAQTALSGLVAALTDLPSAVNATGTRAWAKGADVADGATLNLGSDGNYFVVATGATAVTAISTKQAGCIIVLRFSSARTLTYNATSLILLGAANATTASGDLYWFISEGGGNWRELWRRPVTSASSSNFFRGDGTWAAPAGTGFSVPASSDAESTTVSTTIADLTTFSGLTIAATSTIHVVGNWRKSAGAANAVLLGLKLNTTDLWSNGALGTISSAANQIEVGAFEFLIPPRSSASYSLSVFARSTNSTLSTGNANFSGGQDGALPTVTITDLIIRGKTGNALVTLAVDNVRVFTMG